METSLLLEVQAENYKYCVFIRSIACMLQAERLRVNGDGAHMRQNLKWTLGKQRESICTHQQDWTYYAR